MFLDEDVVENLPQEPPNTVSVIMIISFLISYGDTSNCNLVPGAFPSFNTFTPKISSVILLTVCHTILMMLVWRIWYWIN